MKVDAVIGRALSATGLGIRYKLGAGGMKPGSPTPAAGGKCDCSGFVAWCLGMSRQTNEYFYRSFNGGWFETTAVWTDIGRSVGIFDECARLPGAVVVYPDHDGHQGHIGLIVDDTHVVHCSMGNDREFGNAIRKTSLDVFDRNPNTRYGWLFGLT